MLAAALLLGRLAAPEDPAPARPFGPPALAEARDQGRLAVLQVTRRACPRCQTLVAASVEEPSVAALLAGRFVAARLDPDEQPDVARALADALLLLPEPRPAPDPSLPYVVVTTPDLRVVDGTSLLHEGRALGPGLFGLLARRADEWDEDRGAVETRAGLVLAALREAQAPRGAPGPLQASLLERPVQGLREAFDRRQSAFGVPPRRIPHGPLRLFFEEVERTGDTSLRDMACAALDAVLRALKDQRGGYFREAAGEDWSRPVRERTLADNALLLSALVSAHEATGRPEYAEAVGHAARFLAEGLADPEGGFRHARADGPAGEEVDVRVFAHANGLALSALARSGKVMGRRADLALAGGAAERILARLGPAPSLRRFAEGAALGGPALLEDYAGLALGLLDLHEAGAGASLRDEARRLLDHAIAAFADPAAPGFFASAEDGALRPVRLRDPYDGLLPSGNATMVSALHRLGRLTGETFYLQLARRSASGFAADLARSPRGLSSLAAAVGELVGRSAAPSAPREAALASRATRGGVSFEATVRPERVRPGGAVELALTLTAVEGVVVVAHDPFPGGARPREAANLAPLSLAFPGARLAPGIPRHPEGRAAVLPGSDAPVRVLSGASTLTVPLSVPADAPAGVRRLRIRVVFQACHPGRGCDSPASVLLEAPYAIEVAERGAGTSGPG